MRLLNLDNNHHHDNPPTLESRMKKQKNHSSWSKIKKVYVEIDVIV